MVKEERRNLLERQHKVLERINNKWLDLQKDFYIYESVKDLAYKIAYDLLIANNKDYNGDIYIYYKLYGKKHKIIFMIEENVYMQFDIYWVTTMYGDSGLRIGNGKITNTVKKGYNDIEEIIKDEEE